jgi:large subunit ribosomal protein L4
METIVYNIQGKEKGKVSLPEIFETKVSTALIHEVVVGYLAGLRKGTHSTKTRGEVTGGGRKPWKEKGTGNARAGSNRSPLWRKGGIIFGPKPRNYIQCIPQQKRRLSLEMALSIKAKKNSLIVVDNFTIDEPKTKKMVEVLKTLNATENNILVVVDKIEKNVKLSGRNLEKVIVAEAKNLNAYQVLWANKIIITSSSIEQLGRK